MTRLEHDMLRGFLYIEQALRQPTRVCLSCGKPLSLRYFAGSSPWCDFCDDMGYDARRAKMEEEQENVL